MDTFWKFWKRYLYHLRWVGKIYSANWSEGYIEFWDIEDQEWYRVQENDKYALKSLNNSSDICSDFLNEVI